MTALAASRRLREERWTYKQFPLAAVAVYKGGAAAIDTATGYVTKGAVSTTLKTIGVFDEDVDNSGGAAGDKVVNVKLASEVITYRFVNGTAGDAIAATDIGKPCYLLDDQTVSIVATAHSLAGIVWDVDSTKGVAVAPLVPTPIALDATPTITDFSSAKHGHTNDASGGALAQPAITSFASATHTHENAAGGGLLKLATGATLVFDGSDDCTIATPSRDTHYKVPTTGAASTITLGTTGATRGDEIVFTADGTANGHTVTYYDGATAISAAATASKRHVARCTYDGAKWVCALNVGP